MHIQARRKIRGDTLKSIYKNIYSRVPIHPQQYNSTNKGREYRASTKHEQVLCFGSLGAIWLREHAHYVHTAFTWLIDENCNYCFDNNLNIRGAGWGNRTGLCHSLVNPWINPCDFFADFCSVFLTNEKHEHYNAVKLLLYSTFASTKCFQLQEFNFKTSTCNFEFADTFNTMVVTMWSRKTTFY